MTTKVIGFSGKMYTLWEKETVSAGTGIRNIYTHIKSVSKSLDTAKKLYPEAEINLELRNDKRVLWSLQRTIYPKNTFQFGKYSGVALNECADYDYLKWYFTQVDEAQQSIIKPILEEQGYGVLKNEGGGYYILTPERYQYMLKREDLRNEARKYLQEQTPAIEGFMKINIPITIEPTRNLSTDGKITINEITYIFSDIRRYDFCSQPILDGKAKQIKGKKLVITEYSVDDLDVYVKSFKIEK